MDKKHKLTAEKCTSRNEQSKKEYITNNYKGNCIPGTLDQVVQRQPVLLHPRHNALFNSRINMTTGETS